MAIDRVSVIEAGLGPKSAFRRFPRAIGVGGCAVGALSGRIVTNLSITLRDTLDAGEDTGTRSIAKDQNSLLHNPQLLQLSDLASKF